MQARDGSASRGAWRQAIAEAESAEPGSDEQALALEVAEQCRVHYQEAVERAMAVVAELDAATERDLAELRARRDKPLA